MCVAVGCSPAQTVADAGPIDAGPGSLFPDPASFDCTATTAPARISSTPVACLFDRTCTTRLVSGHRGAGGDLGDLAPEDTVLAYQAAVALGLDYAETDPRPTKDGVLVNVHDSTVERITTGTGAIADMTLAEVRALTFKTEKFPHGDFSCARVATLREVLEASVGKVAVLVDANKTDRVDLLVKDIVDANAIEWAIFDTSSVDKIDRALAIEPRLHTMIRVGSVADLQTQLTHFAAHPPVIVEVDRQSNTAEVAAAVKAHGHRPFTDCFVEDILVNLSNAPIKTYDASWALGIDIAQTDRPAEMLRYLGRR